MTTTKGIPSYEAFEVAWTAMMAAPAEEFIQRYLEVLAAEAVYERDLDEIYRAQYAIS